MIAANRRIDTLRNDPLRECMSQSHLSAPLYQGKSLRIPGAKNHSGHTRQIEIQTTRLKQPPPQCAKDSGHYPIRTAIARPFVLPRRSASSRRTWPPLSLIKACTSWTRASSSQTRQSWSLNTSGFRYDHNVQVPVMFVSRPALRLST